MDENKARFFTKNLETCVIETESILANNIQRYSYLPGVNVSTLLPNGIWFEWDGLCKIRNDSVQDKRKA